MHVHSFHKLSVIAAMTAMLLGSFAAGNSIGDSIIQAQVFNGPGLPGGIEQAEQIEGPVTGGSARDIIEGVLINVLNFLALAAVIAIVVAGIILIASGGNEEAKERAKKIVIYVVIGLVLILLVRVVVSFFTSPEGILH